MLSTVEDVYLLSPMQEGMLFQSLYDDAAGVYIEQSVLRLRGELDPDAFARSWSALVARHDVLRTSFVWEGLGQPHQRVHADVELPIVWHDHRGLAADERAGRFAAIAEDERARRFDLAAAPLFRLVAVRTDEDEHCLVWTFHHLILDGWSSGLLLEELDVVYRCVVDGLTADLPEPVPYREYISFHGDRDLDRERRFWEGELGGLREPTSLVVDTGGAGLGAQERSLDFTPATSARIRRFCRAHRITPHTLITAAWGVLLARYNGSSDALFGVTLSGRWSLADRLRDGIGSFINTVPLRLRVDGQATIGPWLRDVHRQLLGIRDFEHSSLSEVQRWSELPAGRPLVESIVVSEDFPWPDQLGHASGGLTVEFVEGHEHNGLPMSVVVAIDEHDEVAVLLRYDRGRFSADAVARMATHLRVLVEGIVGDPHKPISGLDLVDHLEAKQILVDWTATEAAFPEDGCVHTLFEQHAARTPHARALRFDGGEMSYGELNARANQLAWYLRSLGVAREVPVGLCARRGPEMVVGLLGILKAGGAYVPLDPDYPAARLQYMIEDAQIAIAVSDTDSAPCVTGQLGSVVRLDGDRSVVEGFPTSNPDVGSGPTDLIYILYTSGSTGTPKGVMVEHAGVVNYLWWAREVYGLRGSAGACVIGSISYDLEIPNLLLPLIGGRDVTLVAEQGTLDRLSGLLTGPGDFSLLKITPAHLDVLTAAIPQTATVDSVRTFVVGADEVRAETLHAWRKRAPGARLLNEYGPTETVVGCTAYIVPADLGASEQVPIGRPIANMQMYILDEERRPVPVGVPGELLIGGIGVARGYVNRPDLTAANFTPNPFDHRGGSRLYATGDIARWLPDGNIQFLGRKDHQVKIDGYRIEIGEIEAHLLDHPKVDEGAVASATIRGAQRALVGYYVARGESVSRAELRRFLGERLPRHMIPALWMELDRLPLTANGKVDRAGLPLPRSAADESDDPADRPGSEVEREVARIWREVLGVRSVGLRDNLFELGGNSILATRIVAQARASLAPGLSIRAIFEHPTVEEFAQVVGASAPPGSEDPPVPAAR